MNILTVVTAHTSRLDAARRLCDDLDARIFLDDGTLGEPGNTRQALRWAETQKASHVLVLQDDALPVDGFSELARAAIDERPNHAISYYLGTGRPSAAHFTQVVHKADRNGNRWIDTKRLYWGVAWSLPKLRLANLNEWLTRKPDSPTDAEVGNWLRVSRVRCTHTWPCLVDHADGVSLIHERTERRRAWSLAAPLSATTTEPASSEASHLARSVPSPSTTHSSTQTPAHSPSTTSSR